MDEVFDDWNMSAIQSLLRYLMHTLVWNQDTSLYNLHVVVDILILVHVYMHGTKTLDTGVEQRR